MNRALSSYNAKLSNDTHNKRLNANSPSRARLPIDSRSSPRESYLSARLITAILILTSAFTIGCGGGGGGGNATVDSVSVSPTSAVITKGESAAFSATVFGSGAPSQSVIWSVAGNTNEDTKFSGSTLNVSLEETAKDLTIRAVSVANNAKSATANVRVKLTTEEMNAIDFGGGEISYVYNVASDNLASALKGIIDKGNYIINVSGDVDSFSSFSWEVSDANISIRGTNHNRIKGDADGYTLIIEEGTMILRDIIIDGGSNEHVDAAIVSMVTENGSLILEEGAVIEGNPKGVGVKVGDGNFTMNGGEIRANTASGTGGTAVMVDRGIFIMNDGKIHGNTATTSEDGGGGGGVYVYYEGNFTMNGGAIYENAAKYGAGVTVEGVFTMNGGEICANEASDSGGGVSVRGENARFNKNEGAIICGRNGIDAKEGNRAANGYEGRGSAISVYTTSYDIYRDDNVLDSESIGVTLSSDGYDGCRVETTTGTWDGDL